MNVQTSRLEGPCQSSQVGLKVELGHFRIVFVLVAVMFIEHQPFPSEACYSRLFTVFSENRNRSFLVDLTVQKADIPKLHCRLV